MGVTDRIRQRVHQLRGRGLSLATFVLFQLGGIHVWRRVPKPLRRRFANLIVSPLSDQAEERSPRFQDPVYLACPLTTNSSFGWVSRGTKEILQELNHDPILVDTGAFFDPEAKGSKRSTVQVGDHGTVVYVCNPNQLEYIRSVTPYNLWTGKYRIIQCAWELNRIPEPWHAPLAGVDEIWVPTHFIKDAFEAAALGKRIEIADYRLSRPAKIEPDRNRFSVPDGFVFFLAMHLASGMARKNPHAAVAAFAKASERHPHINLVIKTHGPREIYKEAYDTISTMCDRHPNITHMHADLSDSDMWNLIASCDAILSLHRSEGYGLLLKQGLMLGRPVIGTAWSGNIDFMLDEEGNAVPGAYPVDYSLVPVLDPDGVYPEAPELRWAEANIDDAVEKMDEVVRRARSEKAPRRG